MAGPRMARPGGRESGPAGKMRRGRYPARRNRAVESVRARPASALATPGRCRVKLPRQAMCFQRQIATNCRAAARAAPSPFVPPPKSGEAAVGPAKSSALRKKGFVSNQRPPPASAAAPRSGPIFALPANGTCRATYACVAGVLELTAGVVAAAGVTTTLGFFATKLIIRGMARKLSSESRQRS